MAVKFLSSYNLGVWRGAYRKPKKVPLAPGIDLGSYAAGYDEGARNGASIRAAGRIKRTAANANAPAPAAQAA